NASLSNAVKVWEGIYTDAVASYHAANLPGRSITDAASDYLRTLIPVIKAGARVSAVTSTFDERTAELAKARRDLAALEKAVGERDQELGRYAGRIAAMKSSLSWRFTAPFREMYRPVRRLRASPAGIKLIALLRHPTNSPKRKQYRSKHM